MEQAKVSSVRQVKAGNAERVVVTQPDTTKKLICVSESLAAGSYAKVKAPALLL